jgi:hypothetical protein
MDFFCFCDGFGTSFEGSESSTWLASHLQSKLGYGQTIDRWRSRQTIEKKRVR